MITANVKEISQKLNKNAREKRRNALDNGSLDLGLIVASHVEEVKNLGKFFA